MRKRLLRTNDGLLSEFFPPACPLCLKTFPKKWTEPFCQTCFDGVEALPAAHCSCCALPFISEVGNTHLCSNCIRHSPDYQKVFAAGLHTRTLRQAIHKFKYSGSVNLDLPLGQLLARQLDFADRIDLIIPVPLHPTRLRKRCYNQSLLLARILSRQMNVSVAVDMLLRTRKTVPQQGLSAAERAVNLRGAFIVDKSLEGKSLLLVDDVMTTGATAARCAKVLRAAGAHEVNVAVVARAPAERMQ